MNRFSIVRSLCTSTVRVWRDCGEEYLVAPKTHTRQDLEDDKPGIYYTDYRDDAKSTAIAMTAHLNSNS